jgi:hypothetical protein
LPKGNFGLIADENILEVSTRVPDRQVNYIEWFDLGVERSFGAANGYGHRRNSDVSSWVGSVDGGSARSAELVGDQIAAFNSN